MKRLALKQQLAVWSVLIVAAATLAFAIGAAWHTYEEDLDLLDHMLKDDVRAVVAELKRHGDQLDVRSKESLQAELSAGWHWRLLELRREGKLLFRSAELEDHPLGPDKLSPGYHSIMLTGVPHRMLVVPKKKWEIRIAAPTKELRQSLLELGRGFLVALPGVLLMTAFGGRWIARRALAPVEAITQAAERITARQFDQRLPVPPNRDEIQYLTLVLNGMIDRLESSLSQAQRFSADASHELRTPLTVMRAALEDALSGGHLPAEEQEKLLLDLLDETTQLSAISAKLLLLSRADAGRLDLDLQPANLSKLVREAVEEAEIVASGSGISVEATVPPDLTVTMDAPRLLQVLRNLLENAVKYNHLGGRVRLELLTDSEAVRVRIANTGDSISLEHSAHVFERFYRAEEHRSAVTGHGLGLSISREIALAHGGDVVLVKSDHGWTTFELRLPQVRPAQIPATTT